MVSLAFGARARTALSAGPGRGRAARLPLPLPLALRWGLLIGLAKSTQYLFQPSAWIDGWRNETLSGWVDVARDDIVVAVVVAAAIAASSRVATRTLIARIAILVGSIGSGAIIGEIVLHALSARWAPRDVGYLIAHAVYWIVLAGSIVALYLVWRRNVAAADALHARELQVVELRRSIADAQLEALRHQVEPHFLFNTLATIRHLRQTAPEQGSLLLHNFVAFLRLSISRQSCARDTLGHEIELARAYLEIVVVRMSGRLVVYFDCDESLMPSEFPALALGTLVENAVKHGVAPKPDGGVITVRTRRVGDDLVVEVADTGVGFTGKQGSGIGLVNIRARLRTQYGERGLLELAGRYPSGVRATIRIPLRPTMEST